MKIFVVRHGQSKANVGIDTGEDIVDSELSEEGIRQAERLAARLKDKEFEAIYSSDFRRAKKTADIINKNHGHEVIRDVRLREYNFGEYLDYGKFIEFLDKEIKEKNIPREFISPPKGESGLMHRERIRKFLEEIQKKHKGDILIVAHGGTNQLIHSVLRNLTFEEAHITPQANTCVNEFELIDERWQCNINNCSLHLPIPKGLIDAFEASREEPFLMPEEINGYDGRCFGKHRRLKRKIDELGIKTRFRVARFSWSRQNIPKEIIDLALRDENHHLFLQVKVYSKWLNVDSTYDSRMPKFNEWDARSNTEIAVDYDENLSDEESLDIEEEEKELFVKEFDLWQDFYRELNKYLREIKK